MNAKPYPGTMQELTGLPNQQTLVKTKDIPLQCNECDVYQGMKNICDAVQATEMRKQYSIGKQYALSGTNKPVRTTESFYIACPKEMSNRIRAREKRNPLNPWG